jgi:arabinan endo-1,5-alpha-L-arabinosidase
MDAMTCRTALAVALAAVGCGSESASTTDAGRSVAASQDAGSVIDAPATAMPAESGTAGTTEDAGTMPGATSEFDSGPDAPVMQDGGAPSCDDPFGGGPIVMTTTHLDIPVHDPSMIWDGQDYFLFATGGTLGIRRSADMQTWTNAGNVFGSIPSWIGAAIGGAPSSLWAPDVSYFSGSFHVYYAGSSFGSNDSVIGLTTSPSLQPGSAHWTDRGMVVHSQSSDNYNAIDPSVTFDAKCAPWLSFGSFWSGIKLHKVDPSTGMFATDDPTTYSLASRNGGAIEASSIISHNGYYYLFVSFDACCKGVNSTYRTMVGRATAITGPYTDKSGKDMMMGGAEQILATSGRYIGPGGGTAWRDGDTYLYVFHYYDGDDSGNSKLQVRPILFGSDNWVTLGAPLFP